MSAAPPAPEPLTVPVTDSHTHLDLQEAGVAETVAAAAAVGVATIVQIGIDVASSRWAVDVAREHPTVWATVALHPNEAARLAGEASMIEELAILDELATAAPVRGIGETGLDHYRTDPEHWATQEESFRRHIELAKRHHKTLVIHDRDAHEDVFSVLDSQGAPARVVFHCFSGDAAMAARCADHGYYMSFAGNVTFKRNQALRDAVALAPVDLLLVETDAPFLTPEPYRGRPNAPYLTPWTLRAMAQVKGLVADELAAAVQANSERVFGPFA